MVKTMYYTNDARTPFLAPESVDLFVTHPPYFNTHSEQYGNVQGQLQRTSSPNVFVDSLIKVIQNMEAALKPSGTIVIGIPTSEILYKVIAKITTETELKFGKCFFWDFSGMTEIVQFDGVDSNMFLVLYKRTQYINKDYKLETSVIDTPWVITDELKSKKHIAFVNDFFPEEICDMMINRFSKPGDVVADLFAGTGTVLKSAKKLNREIIYNDVSESQTKLAKIIIDNEEESPMDLKRKEVIDLMTKEIQDMNVRQMQSLNMPSIQVHEYIEQSADELDWVNGLLFDMLVKHGVIR
jgi:DNA modification methylase